MFIVNWLKSLFGFNCCSKNESCSHTEAKKPASAKASTFKKPAKKAKK